MGLSVVIMIKGKRERNEQRMECARHRSAVFGGAPAMLGCRKNTPVLRLSWPNGAWRRMQITRGAEAQPQAVGSGRDVPGHSREDHELIARDHTRVGLPR